MIGVALLPLCATTLRGVWTAAVRQHSAGGYDTCNRGLCLCYSYNHSL